MVARSASGRVCEPVAEVLDELPDDAGLAQDLRHGEDEVGRGRALRQRAHELEADDLRDEHRDRLAEHRGLCLDPADAPAEHAEPVDHRRVRVGPDERVGERDAVPVVDDAREELEVHLVDDPGRRRNDLEVREPALAPAQERVPLAVPLELELGVAPIANGVANSSTCTEWSITSSAGSCGLIRSGAAEVGHRVPHRGEVDDRRHAGEVLEQHAPGRERDLLRRLRRRDPARDGLDVGRGDRDAVLVPEDVLEQDPQRVREAVDVEPRLERLEPEDLELALADREPCRARRSCRDAPSPRFKQLRPAQPVDPALGQRRRRGSKWRATACAYGLPTRQGVRGEALVADRLQVLGVRIEHVLPADLAGGVEEREPDTDRDLEQAHLLPVGLLHERRVDGRELGRARKPLALLAEIGERPLECLDLERRDVDQPRGRAAGALERRRGDRRPTRARASRASDARFLELVDEGVEVDARAAGDVGRGGEDPERREAEREDRSELDDVAGALADGELPRRPLELAGDLLGRPLDAADELDRDPEEVLRGRLV